MSPPGRNPRRSAIEVVLNSGAPMPVCVLPPTPPGPSVTSLYIMALTLFILCTTVIATIGPASQNVDTLVRLLEAGVTCCRVDLTVRAAAPALSDAGQHGLATAQPLLAPTPGFLAASSVAATERKSGMHYASVSKLVCWHLQHFWSPSETKASDARSMCRSGAR